MVGVEPEDCPIPQATAHTHSSCWCCPSLPLGSHLPSPGKACRSAGESSQPSCCPVVSSPAAKSPGASFCCISFLFHCGLGCCGCMGGQCIAPSWQAGVEIPGGNWVWESDSDAEGGGGRREIWFLSTRGGKERGESPQHFVAGMFSLLRLLKGSEHKAGRGMVTSVRDSPYLELLLLQPWIWALLRHRNYAMSTAVFWKQLLLRRNKSTGAKSALWGNVTSSQEHCHKCSAMLTQQVSYLEISLPVHCVGNSQLQWAHGERVWKS